VPDRLISEGGGGVLVAGAFMAALELQPIFPRFDN
jgi:hypothetical protein